MIALLMVIIVGVPLYFDVRIYSVFDLSKITLLYMLVFALVVVWCVGKIVNSDKVYYHSPLMIPIASYMMAAIFATCFAIDPLTSILGTYKRYNGLASLFVYVFLFFIIINYVKRDMVGLFINLIIMSASIICIYGILQTYGIDYYRWNTDYGGRAFSTIGHPAFFSAYLIMSLPLVYCKVIRSRSIYLLLLYLSCVGLILTTFYLTKTRATFVALFVSNIFFFVFLGRRIFSLNKIKIALLLTLIIGISIFSGLRDQSVFKRFNNEINIGNEEKLSGTMKSRYYNILTAIEVIKDYPLLGVGMDSFGIVFQPYILELYKSKGKDPSTIREIQDRVHSEPFDILVTTGILGLLAYAWCVYGYIKMMWRSRNEHRLLLVALGAGVFAYGCQNLFSFGHVPILLLFWFFVGLSVIICKADIPTQSSIH